MSYFQVTLASQGEYASFEVEADSQQAATKRVKKMMARYDKRWSSARVDKVREVQRDVESFGTENPGYPRYPHETSDSVWDMIVLPAVVLIWVGVGVKYLSGS